MHVSIFQWIECCPTTRALKTELGILTLGGGKEQIRKDQ